MGLKVKLGLNLWERILTAPYEERDGWELNIMFVNGVLYLEEHLTEARLQEKCVFSAPDTLTNLTSAETTWLRVSDYRPTMATPLSRIALPTLQRVDRVGEAM